MPKIDNYFDIKWLVLAVTFTATVKERLQATVHKRTSPQQAVLRARIILLYAEGMAHRQIKRTLNTTVDTILLWRGRYKQQGLDGLEDRPRPGRPSAFSPCPAT